MKKIVYLFIGLICIGYGLLSYQSLVSGNNDGVSDLSIYTNLFDRLTNWNTVRGSDFFADHLSPSVLILAPIYRILGLNGLVFLIPFIVILLPIWILDKAFSLNWYQLLLSGLFVGLHPATGNSLLFGVFHGNSLAPLGLIMVVYFWKNSFPLFILAYIFALAIKEDMIVILNLLMVQLALWHLWRTRDWKSLIKPTLICLGITLIWSWLFLSRQTAISYEHANTFSAELTDTRWFVLTHYLIYDLPSFFLGNLSGMFVFCYTFFSDYLINPFFHHRVVLPITTLISYFLFLKRNNENST